MVLTRSLSDGPVTIRPAEPNDVAALVAGRDAVFHRFLGPGDPSPSPVACIVVDGVVVGWVDHDHERAWLADDEVNVGYHVFAQHRGRGYATRAVRLLLEHLAVDTPWRTATLLIDAANERSLALAARLGFERVADLDGHPYWKLDVDSVLDPVDPVDPVLASVAAYTAQADAYEATYAPRYAAIAERFATSLPVPSLIVDVGCGPGRDLQRFVAHGHVARGVELNPVFAAKARHHAPTVERDLREVGSLLPAGFVDGVWAAASLVHLTQAEAGAVLAQFAALLRVGGRLFVSVRSTGARGWLDEPDGRRWYEVWSADEITAAVAAAGFTVDEVAPGPYTELWAHRTTGAGGS